MIPKEKGGTNMFKSCVFLALVVLVAPRSFWAADRKDEFAVAGDVVLRRADIMSEGVRMSAEVFSPRGSGGKTLPTIVMCHGWGGTAAALRPDAVVFARAGYLVVSFDYRGWGASDSRVILTGKAPRDRKDQKFTAEVEEVREVVDPIDQTTDLMNAIHWVHAEKQCDRDRIGLWGSSFSGGHVVYAAARDFRVKAIVSQVPSLDGRWAVSDGIRRSTYGSALARTRGKLGYPRPGENTIGKLKGAPILEKMMGYAPVEDVARAKSCAMLFVIAEKEELFDNRDHGILAHERAPGPKKLVTISDIKHYGIYRQAREQAQKLALEWFDEHLKN